jgi:hypothetical protein
MDPDLVTFVFMLILVADSGYIVGYLIGFYERRGKQ